MDMRLFIKRVVGYIDAGHMGSIVERGPEHDGTDEG